MQADQQSHSSSQAITTNSSASTEELVQQFSNMDSGMAALLIGSLAPARAAAVLRASNPEWAYGILQEIPEAQRGAVREELPSELISQWELNRTFPEGSVGRLMDLTQALFPPNMLVRDAVAALRDLVKREFVTYGYIVENKRLLGVLVMRDLLFASPETTLDQIMLKNPFGLQASMPLMDAMKGVLTRHYPVYPVLNQQQELIGVIRGYRLFEAQAVEISAQAGSMVGVEKEERLSTPWKRSFKFRHPWLQLNLLTAFVAGGVVSVFQETIDQIVILAAFLPVLAGQSGNTGCQALAVTLRGMTLGELNNQGIHKLVLKEGLLGLINGAFVGISAGAGMYFLARSQGNPNGLTLSFIVFFAMMGSCLISGVSGTLVPLGLKKIGADPATASSIFLTTATDVASMGMLLSLATWILM